MDSRRHSVIEVARKGVTVNTVSPGYLATEMVMAVREDVRQKIIDAIPGRLGQLDETLGGIHRERCRRLPGDWQQRCCCGQPHVLTGVLMIVWIRIAVLILLELRLKISSL